MNTPKFPTLKALCIALVLVCLLVVSPPAQALEKTIVLGGPEGGWPPFFIQGAEGQPARGIMADVLRAVASRLGYAMAKACYPEKRGMLYLREGDIDAWPKSVKWVDEPDNYLWTDPVLMSTDVLVFRASDPFPFRTIADLRGKSLGVIHGHVYPTLNRLFKQDITHRQKAITVKNMLKMLERGHVDGAVCNRHVVEWILRTDNDLRADEFSFSDATVDSAPYGFAFTRKKGWKEFIPRFNRELLLMRRDGRLQAILSRYK